MLLERRPSPIPLEEMKFVPIIAIPSETVIDRARLILRESGRLGVDGFEGICVFGVGVDNAEYAEFVFGDGWELREEIVMV